MKHGPLLTLVLAAALAAAPAMAQRKRVGHHRRRARRRPGNGGGRGRTAGLGRAGGRLRPGPGPGERAGRPAGDGTIPTPQPAAASTGGLLQTVFALIFVLALLVGAAWALKRFGPKNFGGGNSNIKLVGALSVGTARAHPWWSRSASSGSSSAPRRAG